MGDRLTFRRVGGQFKDRYRDVTVWEVSGGPGGFLAFVYQCSLNLDIDGSPTTYGLDNPAAVNSKGQPNLQKDLEPLENWHKGKRGVSRQTSQMVGLGNACGNPGDGTTGWDNWYNQKNRKFYWAGVQAVTKAQARALSLVIDDRPELEAGLDQNYSTYFQKFNKLPDLLPKGSGYFPVVQQEGGPAKGYYVSTTSVAADGDASVYDPNRYLDAARVPYAVWANLWGTVAAGGKKLNQGDYGIAIRTSTGANTGFLYGDSGTDVRVGESSQKLYDTLGGEGSQVTFIAFPGSGTGGVVGKNPEAHIRARVIARSAALGAIRPGSVGSDLALFLATGIINPKKPMTVPPSPKPWERNYNAFAVPALVVGDTAITSQQAREINNAYSALSNWISIR